MLLSHYRYFFGHVWFLAVFARPRCQHSMEFALLAMAALVLYLVAQFGQKIGAEQMFTLHHFFEDSIGHRIHID